MLENWHLSETKIVGLSTEGTHSYSENELKAGLDLMMKPDLNSLLDDPIMIDTGAQHIGTA